MRKEVKRILGSPKMSLSDNRPVFVLATADNCGHCVDFKNRTWDQLKSQIEHDNKVRVVELNLPKTTSRIEDLPESQYIPKDVKRFIRWFPTMFIIDGKSWNQGVKDKETKLVGSVFNGREKDGIYEYVGGGVTENAILSWIDNECQKSTIHVDKPTYFLSQNGQQVNASTLPQKEVVPTYGTICSRRMYRSRI